MTEMKTLQFGEDGEVFEIVDEKVRNKAKNLIKVTDGEAPEETDLVVGEEETEIEVVTTEDISELTEGLTQLQTAVGGKYTKPADGIPETDLSAEVQTKLNSGGGGGDNWELIEKHTDLSADVRNIITNAKVDEYKKFLVFLNKPAANAATEGYLRAYAFNGQTAAVNLTTADSPKSKTRLLLYVEFISDSVILLRSQSTSLNATAGVQDARLISEIKSGYTFGIYNNNGIQCYDGTETLWIFGVRR